MHYLKIKLSTLSLNSHFNLNETIILNKIIFWLSKCGRQIEGLKGKWIYNTLNDWHEQFPYWSMSTLRRTIKSLEESGILLSKKVNAKRWKHTKWYSIDFNKLNKIEENKSIKQKNDIIKSDNKKNKNSNIALVKKRTNRCVQNEQIIYTNNYTKDTKVSSSKRSKNIFKSLNQEFDSKLNKLIEKKVDKKLSFIKNEDKEIESKLNEEQLGKVKEMKETWNKVFEYSISPIIAYANKKNTKVLYKLLEEKFEGNLDKWKEYAYKVNSSQFLMGEKKTKTGFKASFAWLIKEETVEKINAGEYGIGSRELDMNNLDKNIKEREYEIKTEAVKKVSDYLKNNIDKETEGQEFKEYLLNEKYEEDGDKYKVKNYMEKVSKYQMYGFYVTPSHFFYPNNEKHKEKIFNSYLMSKYFEIDELTFNSRIKDALTQEKNKKMRLQNIKSLGEKIKTFSIEEGIKKMLMKLDYIPNNRVINI